MIDSRVCLLLGLSLSTVMELNILKHIIAFVNKYYRIFANIEIYIDLKSSELFVSYSTILIDLCFVVAIHLFVFKIYSFI